MYQTKEKSILFLDFDGTLWFGKIASGTVKAIKKVKELGNFIILDSGRSKGHMIPEALSEINPDGFIYGSSHYEFNGKKLLCDVLSESELNAVCDVTEKYNLKMQFEGVKGNYITKADIPDGKLVTIKEMREHYKEYPVTKITFCGDSFFRENDVDTINPLAVEELGKIFTMVRFPSYYEGFKRGYDKSTGMKFFEKYLDVKHKNTYGFGDSLNDLAMVKYAAHGVAIAGAPKELTDVAEYVTKEKETGVAEAIKKYFNV